MRTQIISQLTVKGIHRWLGANDLEYSYLKNFHGHKFLIEARKDVGHDDRDIEIIQFARKLEDYLNFYYDGSYKMLNFRERSCEMIAKELVAAFGLDYCSVREDGENGAVVTLDHTEVFALVGYAGSGKSALAQTHYYNWNVIEVGAIVRTLTKREGRTYAPDLAADIACEIIDMVYPHKKNLIVGIRQPEIIDILNNALGEVHVIRLDKVYEERKEGLRIDKLLNIDNITPNVTLPWTIL